MSFVDIIRLKQNRRSKLSQKHTFVLDIFILINTYTLFPTPIHLVARLYANTARLGKSYQNNHLLLNISRDDQKRERQKKNTIYVYAYKLCINVFSATMCLSHLNGAMHTDTEQSVRHWTQISYNTPYARTKQTNKNGYDVYPIYVRLINLLLLLLWLKKYKSLFVTIS